MNNDTVLCSPNLPSLQMFACGLVLVSVPTPLLPRYLRSSIRVTQNLSMPLPLLELLLLRHGMTFSSLHSSLYFPSALLLRLFLAGLYFPLYPTVPVLDNRTEGSSPQFSVKPHKAYMPCDRYPPGRPSEDPLTGSPEAVAVTAPANYRN